MQCGPHYNEMLSSYEINLSITTLGKPYNAFGDLLDFLKSSLLTRKLHHENNMLLELEGRKLCSKSKQLTGLKTSRLCYQNISSAGEIE